MKERILITGASGQIGTVLTQALREKYGSEAVLATDIRRPDNVTGLFEELDIMDKDRIGRLLDTYEITQIYHLAAILSAKGEQNPQWAWNINMNGVFHILDSAVEKKVSRVFIPSSIAVFGPETPRVDTPQETVLSPTTVYGISKVAGEHWGRYYYEKFGLDVRAVRYPGIIGYQSMPGGGTTDYAVDIYHYAVKDEPYTCFLREDTRLPMMYMDDAIRATLEIMEAPADQIKTRTAYNLAAMSFTPAEITEAIRKHRPDFKVDYQPDYRQAIADSWTESIDDAAARKDWGWQHHYDLTSMTADMLVHLEQKYSHSL
jgi:threonine 3-dehydrogenase